MTNDDRPAYRRVTDDIEADIAAGRLGPGHTVPSIAQIMEKYGYGVSVAQDAIRYLTMQGIVETVRGSGTFVRKDRPWIAVTSRWWTPQPPGAPDLWTARTRAAGRDGTQRILSVGPVEPPERVRAELGLDAGETAVLRDRVMYLDDTPVQIARSYFPHDVADGTELAGPRKIRGGSATVLALLVSPPVLVRETAYARMPDGAERAALSMPNGVPVMDLLLCVVTAEGRAVEVAVNVVRGDLQRLRYEHDV